MGRNHRPFLHWIEKREKERGERWVYIPRFLIIVYQIIMNNSHIKDEKTVNFREKVEKADFRGKVLEILDPFR